MCKDKITKCITLYGLLHKEGRAELAPEIGSKIGGIAYIAPNKRW